MIEPLPQYTQSINLTGDPNGISFTPRSYQLPFFQALDLGYKRLVLVWHRRAGKDISILNATCQAMLNDGRLPYGGVGVYYYFFPTFAQGKKIIWDGITKDGIPFLDYIPKALRLQTWNDEMKIRMVNGSIFQIIGTDNFDAVMGTNPIWCVFSEFALQNPKAWEYVRPILKENNGVAIFPYTPRGRNHGYTLYYKVALKNPDSRFAQLLTIENTGVLTSEDVQQEIKEGMSEDLARQEYYCDFNLGIEGSYYAKYIQAAKDEGRVKKVLLDTAKPVHTAWDIGVTDFTSIIFFQVFPGEYHIIDFYENSGEGVQHYAKVLQDKGYVYGNHYAPHDIKAKQWVSEGEPTIQVARRYGINFQLVPKLSREDGIEAARNLLSKCYFDEEKTKILLIHLENYSKIFNKTLNCYSSTPKKDGHDHAADAFRYLAVAEKSPEVEEYNLPQRAREIDEYIKKHSNRYSAL